MKYILDIFKKIFGLPKKFLIPGVILILVLGFFLLRHQSSRTQQFQFGEVRRGDIKSTVSSSGTLTGKNTANLKFKSSGRLAYVNVSAGMEVTKGQVIAGLDTQDLAIKLQQAQNTLRDKQAAAEKILDDVKNSDKDETFTEKKDRTAAEVARDNAYDAVKEAQRAFQDAVIVSPISGLVTQVPVVPGQIASDLVAQVVDISEIFFDTEVDEADIGRVSLAQKVEVTWDAYGDRIFEGSVSEIIPQTKTTSQGAIVITVRIKLSSPPSPIIYGLTGEASIIVGQAENILTIPLEALRDDNTVVIQDEGSLRFQNVTPGIYSDTDVEIKEGLREGERIILNPPENLNGQNKSQGLLNGHFIFLRGDGGGSFGGGQHFNGAR